MDFNLPAGYSFGNPNDPNNANALTLSGLQQGVANGGLTIDSNPNTYNGGVNGVSWEATQRATAQQAAQQKAKITSDEQAYYDQQISDLDRLLGRIGTTESQGLESLNSSAAENKRLLNEQKTKAFAGYDAQKLENDQNKERGFGQVNDFANTSYRNLMRLFQGGNAGGGSAARVLAPSLVSKSAGTRRQGVIEQAGTNERNIVNARGDANDQFNYNEQDLENQRKQQELSFLQGIGNQRNTLESQKGGLQVQRAQANGEGYAQARTAGEASRNSVEARQAQLDALFGNYKPQFTARATNLQKPTLGQYTIDPAQINGNQNLSVDSRYYGTQLGQLKKKQQEQGF